MNDIKAEDIKFEDNPARQSAALIPVRATGVEILNFSQQVDFAKFMATAGFAVPRHLRQNVGACLAILDMSQRWGFQPYMVARMSYVVNDVLCWEAQLIHAVIERFAPLRNRLRPRYEGEGDERRCIVVGHMKGEVEPLDYVSPRIGGITPKNSPLWKTDPDQQLWYYSSRAWCRRHCPDVLLGIYGRDELQDNPHIGFDNARDVTPESAALAERLSNPRDKLPMEGFRPDAVEAGLSGVAQQAETVVVDASEVKKAPTLPQDTPKQPDPDPIPPPPKNRGGRPPLTEQQRAERAAAKEAAKRPEMPTIPEQFRRTEPEPAKEDTVEPAAPAPDRGAALVRPLPATVGEYAEHVDRWTKTVKTPQEAEAQWAAEISLRNKCGLVEQERMQIRRWVDDCIKKLRGGK